MKGELSTESEADSQNFTDATKEPPNLSCFEDKPVPGNSLEPQTGAGCHEMCISTHIHRAWFSASVQSMSLSVLSAWHEETSNLPEEHLLDLPTSLAMSISRIETSMTVLCALTNL